MKSRSLLFAALAPFLTKDQQIEIKNREPTEITRALPSLMRSPGSVYARKPNGNGRVTGIRRAKREARRRKNRKNCR